ncbi:hypothetical protein HDV00_005781 [Rhizophlyctis rosea]|nr:hypothetical protein HDV00_005781 [Rhizophlyctis rosea]
MSPCLITLLDVPEYHGVSRSTFRNLPTVTIHADVENALNTSLEMDAVRRPEVAHTSGGTPHTGGSSDREPSVQDRPSTPIPNQQQSGTVSGRRPRGRLKLKSSVGVATVATAADLGSDTCVVCMESWKAKEKAKKLPCGHAFHVDCIKVWLDEHSQCPMCRQTIQ